MHSALFRIEGAAKAKPDKAAGAEDHRSAYRLLELNHGMRQLATTEAFGQTPARPAWRPTGGIGRWSGLHSRMLAGRNSRWFGKPDICARIAYQPHDLGLALVASLRFQMAVEHNGRARPPAVCQSNIRRRIERAARTLTRRRQQQIAESER